MASKFSGDVNITALVAQSCSIKYISSTNNAGSPFTLLSGNFEGRQRSAANRATVDRQRHWCSVCKLNHVNPVTSATGERSFSTARRIKTWLRSRMLQARFNHLAILNTHKDTFVNLCLVSVANSFVSLNENRERNCGKFTTVDFSRWTYCFPCRLLYMHFSRKLTSAYQLVLFPQYSHDSAKNERRLGTS